MSSEAACGPVYYLHGFASSPESTKARFFAERLAPRRITFLVPDLNAPDFASLTISRMLAQLTESITTTGGRATLIGSSLGAALAVLAACQMKTEIERLVLLAPAVMLAKPGHSLLPPARIAEWQRRGAMPFFHHGFGEERLLNFAFHTDSLRHDPYDVDFAQPTLIFQGLRDSVVDYRSVEQFARVRANVTLSLLDDDHQLTASVPRIWQATEAFLGIAE